MPSGYLLGLGRFISSPVFAVQEVGLEGGQVELSRRLVNQEADLGPGVILQFGIDPPDGFFETLFHGPYFGFSISDFEFFKDPGVTPQNPKFAIRNPKY